jgi:hypothetical protein
MLIKIGVGLLAVILGLASAGVLALLQGGIATVYVETSELTLFLPVPLAAADIALQFLPEEELQKIREDITPHKELVLAAIQELVECPDSVLVEVQSRDEYVLVEKEGSDLIVKVDEAGEAKVRVAVPMHSIARLFATLAG